MTLGGEVGRATVDSLPATRVAAHIPECGVREGMIADSLNLDILDVLQRDVHVLRQLRGKPILDGSERVQVHQVLNVGLHCVQTRS